MYPKYALGVITWLCVGSLYLVYIMQENWKKSDITEIHGEQPS